MSILKRAAAFVGRKALTWSGTYSLSDGRLSSLLGGMTTYTGKLVSQDVALSVSAIWACVRIISESLGSLPLHVMRKEAGGGATVADDHPLHAVLVESPNADQTTGEYREGLGGGLCLDGNAYSLREYGSRGRLVALTPIAPDAAYPVRNNDGIVEYRVLDRGKWETYPADKIWHVRGFGSMGLKGYSPIGLMRQAVGLALATEEYGARLFGQGARPASIVEVPEWLSEEQRAAAYKKLETMYAGLDNAHKPFVLEGGMKHVNVSMPPDDAQFILTRKFQIAEICRIYRIPLHMVQEMDGSTNNNIEWQGQSLATHTLLPYFTRIEQSISKYLLSPEDRRRYFVRFNFEGLLRADTASRAQFYVSMLQNGVMSRNEVRNKENLPLVEGLDEFTVQSNMAPIEALSSLFARNNATPDSAGD